MTVWSFQKGEIISTMKKLFDRSGLASLLFMGAVSAFLVLAIDYYMFAVSAFLVLAIDYYMFATLSL